MNVIIQLLNNKDVSQQVKKKILQLIQMWGLRFEDDSDVLPLFSSVYGALKQRNLPFPNEDEARGQVSKLKDALEGKAPMPDSKPLDKKHAKLRKDLEVVIQNVVLANEMIDAHDVDEEVDENDALVSLVQSLKTFESKIMELIEKIKNDEVMNLALLTNDDLQKTVKRFKKLEHGRVPDNFKPECRKYLPGYREEPAKSKKPEPKQERAQQRPTPVERKPEPVSQSRAPPKQDDDIFGYSDPAPAPQASAKPAAPAKSSIEDDIFGISFDEPTSGGSQPSSQPKVDSNISKLNEIMEKMTLEKNQQASQFATAGPGMGGPGMGGPGMGGFGMGGGGFNNFGPSPGMFNTGIPPQNNMYGGGNMYGGNPGFNTNYNQPPGGYGGGGFGGGGFGGGGFSGGGGFGGGGFGGGSGFGDDPFSQKSGGSIFQTAPSNSTNYNPGGGPDAFKGQQKKPKKVEKGPKEFTSLFSMADKITDRTNQPMNRVDDYVTSYKNSFGDTSAGGFDMGNTQSNNSQADDFFGGGGAQAMPAASNSQQNFMGGGSSGMGGGSSGMGGGFGNTGGAQNSSDPFGGMDDVFGGGGSSSGQNDMFGGSGIQKQPSNSSNSNQYDAFGGGQSNQPSQDNLYDIFGDGGQQTSSGQPGGQRSSEDDFFNM